MVPTFFFSPMSCRNTCKQHPASLRALSCLLSKAHLELMKHRHALMMTDDSRQIMLSHCWVTNFSGQQQREMAALTVL